MTPGHGSVALSVVIPCRNGALTLPRQLAALAEQAWDGTWEVVVADNGSTDGTAAVAMDWSSRLPTITVVDASQRAGAAYARNVGAARARYDHILWLDADDEVRPGFLAAMAVALETDEFCCGTWEAPFDAPHLESLPGPAPHGWRALIADPGFLDAAGACNGLAVSRAALDRVGGFPEEMTWGSEDTAFCWAMQLAGYPMVRVEAASVAVYPRKDPASLWHQQVQWGIGAVDAYRRFRNQGAPRSNTWGALARWGILVVSAPVAMIRSRWRYQWLGTTARRWGRVTGSLRFRTVYL
jgi:glycosyltransferase involved in cell wall biosynthesis